MNETETKPKWLAVAGKAYDVISMLALPIGLYLMGVVVYMPIMAAYEIINETPWGAAIIEAIEAVL